ncbi:MAG: DUF4118 domain-containing protein [Planctomycetes bacterium]|nr:DUF4118 domain-containing protein [Planctomycetota bacterium]
MALALTGATTLLIFLVKPFLVRGVMVLYIPAVMGSAWYGGLGPGLLSTVLSVATTAFLFLDPAGSFTIQSADDFTELAVFSFVALLTSVLNTAQKRAQQALLASQEKVRLVFEVTRAANEAETVGHAFRFALRRICEGGLWIYAHIYLPPDRAPQDSLVPSAFFHATEERFRPLREATLLPRGRDELIAGRVMKSGGVEWVEELGADPARAAYEPFLRTGVRTAAAFPVKVGRDTIGVFECFSLERVEKRESLTALLEVVGLELGRVVERRQLQDGYSEAVWQQQRVLAQELHDGLGQELTGLGFISQSLTEKLKDSGEGASARRLTEGLSHALEQIRNLAKGVFPVAPDAEGLMSALRQLAESTASTCSVSCAFECPAPVPVENNQVALHLYRIAQEAVTNAVKHGHPSRVTLELRSAPGELTLSVTDDGTGIDRNSGRPAGSGLRIMRYRAAAIGAALDIGGAPGRGTRVTCRLGDGGGGAA